MATTKRAPVKALNQTPANIRKASEAERARKQASKKALHAALDAEKTAKKPKPVIIEPTAEELQMKRDTEYANYLKALREDAAALGVDPEAYITEQLKPVKTQYTGPMLALKSARKTYVKAANGIQCNGDNLATLCGLHTREETVAALIIALGLPGNPYTHLNPGQQSMNLRNKARHQVNTGALSFAQIEAAFNQVKGA